MVRARGVDAVLVRDGLPELDLDRGRARAWLSSKRNVVRLRACSALCRNDDAINER